MVRTVGAALAAAMFLMGAVAAHAQAPLAPSLTVDDRFAQPDGIARDALVGEDTDIPSAVAVSGDRIYTVGEARNAAGDSNVGIVARRTDGTFATGFSGDGMLILPIAAGTGKDVGTDIVVLPDGRLRILASTDTDATATTQIDVAIVGLLADGSPDPAFPTRIFPAGPGEDTPTRMVLGPGGRLAVTGAARNTSGREDVFVSLREPDGSPVAGFGTGGVRVLDAAGNALLNDRGVDVEFRPGGGLLVLAQVETNLADSINDYQAVLRGFSEVTGADDAAFNGTGSLVLPAGQPDTVPGGLMVYQGRIWASGATKVGTDTDAFIARLNPDGSGVETRRYDMRGTAIDSGQLVVSSGSDLDVVPGIVPTLIVTGSINYNSRPYWAAAAFNNLDGPLAAAGFGDFLLPTDEYGAIVGVAASPDGWAAIAGSLVDINASFDTSFGTARLLVDADKACDLALDVVAPLEMTMPASGVAPVALRVTNGGTKTCTGGLSVPAPYALEGGATAFELPPGAVATTAGLRLRYNGPRRRDDQLTFRVSGAGDTNAENDVRSLRVLFSYCDVALEASRGTLARADRGAAPVRALGPQPRDHDVPRRPDRRGARRLARRRERALQPPGRAQRHRRRARGRGGGRPGRAPRGDHVPRARRRRRRRRQRPPHAPAQARRRGGLRRAQVGRARLPRQRARRPGRQGRAAAAAPRRRGRRAARRAGLPLARGRVRPPAQGGERQVLRQGVAEGEGPAGLAARAARRAAERPLRRLLARGHRLRLPRGALHRPRSQQDQLQGVVMRGMSSRSEGTTGLRRSMARLLLLGPLAAAAALLIGAPGAALAAGDLDDTANQWLPRADGAEWVYAWSNTDFSPTPRLEQVRVQARAGTSFRLRWDEIGTGPYDTPASGTIDFKHTDAGLVNLNYQSTQPPPQFPILCASATDCGNSLAGTFYLLIWGTRSPTLAEPLVKGTRWNSLGGAGNDVGSSNRYLGRERVTVPAFPGGVLAAKIESEVTQAGAIGDPFGSGVRTVYWVRGVGPVLTVFRHAGGEISRSELQSTNRAALPLPADDNLLPLNKGDRATLPLAQQPPHEAVVAPAVRRRPGGQQLGARRREEPLGPDPRRRRLHVLDPAERRHAALRRHARGDPRDVPAARPARRGLRQPPPLLHPVRPDGVRLQPRRARLRGQGGELAQLARQPRLPDLRRHGRVQGARQAARADARRPVHRARGALDAAPARLPLRQRHPDELVRAGQGPRQAEVPSPRRQCLHGRATELVGRRCGAVVLLLAAAAGLGACGGGDDGPRERVEDYVRDANTVARRFAGEFEQANAAYVAYSRGELRPARARTDLTAAAAAIRTARGDVADLDPPPDAQSLHEKYLRYLDMNVGFAEQTLRLAVYTPGAARALQPLDRVNRRLDRQLSAATEPGEQADALRRFTRSLDGMLADLRGLAVPAVLRPTHEDQIRRLSSTRSLARRLRAALIDQDARRVARLLKRFRAGAGDRTGSRKLAAKAIRAYERRYKALSNAYADVQREQSRLDREFRENP